MQNFTIWTEDNPQPVPPVRSSQFIANKVLFVKAQFNRHRFYISAADDEGEFIQVRAAYS